MSRWPGGFGRFCRIQRAAFVYVLKTALLLMPALFMQGVAEAMKAYSALRGTTETQSSWPIMIDLLPLVLFVVVCLFLMAGYPVALTMAGVSLLFAGLGELAGVFDPAFISVIPNRVYGILVNQNLFAVPLFVFMGSMLERSRIAEDLLKNMELVFRALPGGLGISVILVGMLLAASTGIVGATVVTMGILSLPTMPVPVPACSSLWHPMCYWNARSNNSALDLPRPARRGHFQCLSAVPA